MTEKDALPCPFNEIERLIDDYRTTRIPKREFIDDCNDAIRRGRAMTRAPALEALRKIAHMAYHLVDDSEADCPNAETTVFTSDLTALRQAVEAAEEIGAFVHGEPNG